MKKTFTLLIAFSLVINFLSARDIFVATTGNDSNPGTEALPYLNIQTAVNEAQPGDFIYVRGGTYKIEKRIKIEKAGTEDARISLFGYPGERVIIDGTNIKYSNVNEFKQGRCIYVNHFGDYWHFKNLEMCNAPDNGMKLEGSYNIVENCVFYGNNDTGLQIGMYKDFSIEETKSFPISGSPTFNPNYTYCKYNVVLNCDSYNNYDSRSFNGSDDGGDADGFAAKLFPGPGTEFHGCRAWNNSDDNWDLYMVYHPIVINNCWSWNGGKDANGVARGNGNGFKLGGGGTSGGAQFAQSVGAHLVTNCVSFNCVHKGFDQNNAYEAMYLFNNVAWGNEYNYRFPTKFEYGTMYMRNNIGFKPTKLNHEFLSVGKDGYKMPDTDFNSWTTLDGCDPIKDGNKVGSTKVNVKDYTAQFLNLTEEMAKAERQADGSLPENDFARLIASSLFINAGQNIENFEPAATSPGGLTLPNVTIPYNDGRADMGAFETGDPTIATLVVSTGKSNQTVYTGTAIQKTVYKWDGAATDVALTDLPAGLEQAKDIAAKTLTISGIPTQEGTYTVANVGGENSITLTGTISISTIAPATLEITEGQASQEVFVKEAMATTVFTWGGGATDVTYTVLPAGLEANKDMATQTLTISGIPTADGSFYVSTVGGMDGSTVVINCNITRVIPTRILTGDWYNIQDEFANIPQDLKDVVSIQSGSDSSFPTVWNPAYTESGGSAPGGCTTGAVNIERGGSVTWVLPNVVEFKANVHFTGTRTLKVDYTIDGVTKTWTSASLSKRTMANWDILSEIGLETVKKPITIKLYHTSTNGGMRLYDFFIKIYDEDADLTAIGQHEKENVTFPMYQTETALVVQGEIQNLAVYSVSGALVSQSQWSQTVATGHLSQGIYIVRIHSKDGKFASQKFVKQ